MSLKHLACASAFALSLFALSAPSRADVPPPDTIGGDTTESDTATPTDTLTNDTGGTTSEGGGGCSTGATSTLGLAFGVAALLRLRTRKSLTES